MNCDPFFIIGAPRSGTTMLQQALNRHSRIVIPPETHFFTLVLRSYRGQRRHWDKICKDLQVNVELPCHRIRPGADARKEFWRIAEAYAARLGKESVTHFGEKSPEHQRRFSGILKAFPDARFILIYRDGRDVALSLTKTPWMPDNLDFNFFLWLHYYRIQCRFLQREPHRVICVRYEDLVQNPRAELRPVLEFLGLEEEPDVADGSGNREGVPDYELSYKSLALKPISAERIGNWQRELSHKQIARLESWGGWALRELGYECVTDGKTWLPPWHFPALYCRLTKELLARTLQRKTDEWLGTCFYRPNRIARDLPDPEPLIETTEAANSRLPIT